MWRDAQGDDLFTPPSAPVMAQRIRFGWASCWRVERRTGETDDKEKRGMTKDLRGR